MSAAQDWKSFLEVVIKRDVDPRASELARTYLRRLEEPTVDTTASAAASSSRRFRGASAKNPANRLRALRVELGYELGATATVPPRFVTHWSNGKDDLPDLVFDFERSEICVVLAADVSVLFPFRCLRLPCASFCLRCAFPPLHACQLPGTKGPAGYSFYNSLCPTRPGPHFS